MEEEDGQRKPVSIMLGQEHLINLIGDRLRVDKRKYFSQRIIKLEFISSNILKGFKKETV